MSMNIPSRQDVSFLFSGLGKGASNVASSNFLGEYAQIKNGSYAKLMKAYYGKNGSEATKKLAKDSVRRAKEPTQESKLYAKVISTTDALKDAADAMLEGKSKSIFEKKEITQKDANGVEQTTLDYDKDAIYKAVDSFISAYNAVIKAVDDVDNKSIENRASSMVGNSIANLKMLNQIGVTINMDTTMSVDKESFMKVDMGKVKALFGSVGSYGYQASAQASMMNFVADSQASKQNTYRENGTYSNFNTGNLFNGYF